MERIYEALGNPCWHHRKPANWEYYLPSWMDDDAWCKLGVAQQVAIYLLAEGQAERFRREYNGHV